MASGGAGGEKSYGVDGASGAWLAAMALWRRQKLGVGEMA